MFPHTLGRLGCSLFMLYLLLNVVTAASAADMNFGRWSEVELEALIASRNMSDNPGAQIVALSGHFIDTPYSENTLIGGPDTAERLVLNLEGFDCFTFLDVIEAFRRAGDLQDVTEQLKKIRYIDGLVSYANRRHFFSDWAASGVEIKDVTAEVGQGRAQTVTRQLNLKSDGSLWLPGLAITPRQITFIPTAGIDAEILSALQPGDYIGLFTSLAGLDVSHTGLIVKKNGKVFLRHASSRKETRRVVDEDLLAYLQDKPGLLVYRVTP